MIIDKCVCGAKFKTRQDHWRYESDDHLEWLRAHSVCREKAATSGEQVSDVHSGPVHSTTV